MGKTERILANLPPTFRPLPRPSALYSVANAIGLSLQEGENLLVAVMKAHWVDQADRGRTEVLDLDLIASLYGLQSRPDEGVEAFREHLKRHVKTLLEGTATVRGILRVAADTLGLTIDTETLRHPAARRLPRDDDATRLLFGVPWTEATGSAAQKARLTGRNDLSSGVDLRSAGILELEIDGTTRSVDLAAVVDQPERASLGDVVAAVNLAFGTVVATHDGRYPTLMSPSEGASAHVELLTSTPLDAADVVFGIPPRRYQGSDARPAELIGAIDLSGGVDLSTDRYLRLVVDAITIAEIDCAGSVPAATTLDEVVGAINGAVGQTIASHDNQRLLLRTSETGLDRSIEVQPSAANDATGRLLGINAHGYYAGANAAAARAVGRQMLDRGADLSTERNLVVQLDGSSPVEIDCAGAVPEQTSLQEIVDKINAGFPSDVVATHDGFVVTLTSSTNGASSSLEILSAAQGDAALRILGFPPPESDGRDSAPGSFVGEIQLTPRVDLRLRHQVTIARSNQATVEIDVRGPVPGETTPSQIAAAINSSLGQDVASVSEYRLMLSTVNAGADQWIALFDRALVEHSPFLTQAPILDEAATTLFGFVEGRAEATADQPATLVGQVILSSGMDLRTTPYLRIGIDDQPQLDVDCRGGRPRVTLSNEIAERINQTLGVVVASVDAGHVIITSPTAGRASRVTVGLSTASDAATILLGLNTATAIGQDAAGVVFTGTVDLGTGLHVSDRYMVRIGIDDQEPVDIDLRGDLATIPDLPDLRVDLDQIVDTLNAALGEGVAAHDGRLVMLRSLRLGPESGVVFDEPADTVHDATADLLGVSVPRSYSGSAASTAEMAGLVEISGPIDLSQRHHLRLAFDGQAPQDIDCAGTTPAATTLDEVVEAIETAFGPGHAQARDNRLVLSSESSGAQSAVAVTPSTVADASEAILGIVPAVSLGVAGTPASLTGLITPPAPVDLSERGTVRLAVDGGPPRDINVQGASPARTSLEEVARAINARLGPSKGGAIATVTADGRLTISGTRSVELFPRRALTLIEFPASPAAPAMLPVEHGSTWSMTNSGAAPAPVTITLQSRHGVVRPTLIDRNVAARLRIAAGVGPGQTLRVQLDENDLPLAEIDGVSTSVETVPSRDVLLLPTGASNWQYLECLGARFDYDRFQQAYFVGGRCRAPGVFDESHFVEAPDAPELAVFASASAGIDTGTSVTFTWEEAQPGRFVLDLPQDLPPAFGARFGSDRFNGSLESTQDLIIETEPLPGSLMDWINQSSTVIEASAIESLPEGAVAQRVPWDRPIALAGGRPSAPARLFVTEEGLTGFIEIRAREAGSWGNAVQITIAAGNAGGAYRVTIQYTGNTVYENAVAKVREQILPARAAGIRSEVSRGTSADWR